MQVFNWLAMRRTRKDVAQVKHATNSLMHESREAARVVAFAAGVQQGSDEAERAAALIRAAALLAVRAAPQLPSTEGTS
jgi:transcriptional regulator of met regulon